MACDKIYMPEGTEIEILGPRMIRQHYKGLLDKLGMQFDVLRMGRCKGAYEPFTHEKMSDEVRENYQSLIDDRYEQLVETIAAGRHLEAAKVKELIDHGIFTPDAALKAGLVDYVVYASRMEDELKNALKADENLKIVTNYKKKKKEEITSVFDLMKLFAAARRPKNRPARKKSPWSMRPAKSPPAKAAPAECSAASRKARRRSRNCSAKWPTTPT